MSFTRSYDITSGPSYEDTRVRTTKRFSLYCPRSKREGVVECEIVQCEVQGDGAHYLNLHVILGNRIVELKGYYYPVGRTGVLYTMADRTELLAH